MDQLIGLFIALLVFFLTSRRDQKQKKRASEDPHSERLFETTPQGADRFDKLPQDGFQKRVPTRRRILREQEHKSERQKHLSAHTEKYEEYTDINQNECQVISPLPPQVEFLRSRRASAVTDLTKRSGRRLMIDHEILSPPKVFRKDSK